MSVGERTIVRLAGPDDLEWCVVEDEYVTERVIRRKIVDDEIIVAEIDGQLVGYLRVEYLWSRIPYIGMIFVLERYRDEDVEKDLLNFLVSFLSSRGHDMLLSSSRADRPEMQAWHRNMGFSGCGIISGINEGEVGEIFFRKSLT